MNLRDLQYLVAVADHRHFRKAAEACFVSQPTLSTQLKKLEAELGVDLIERSPGNVMLTAVGRDIVDRARIMLREADDIGEIARRAKEPGFARLRIGLFPTLAPYLLPHVVPAVRDRFPKLELRLVEEKTEEVLQDLRDGKLDAGVLALPIHEDQMHEEPLFEEDFVLAVPVDHRLAAAAGPVPVSIIAGESVLLLEDGHCLRDQALAVCQLSGASEKTGFRATSLETLRQMVAAGVGVTLLPRLAVAPPVAVYDSIRLIEFSDPVPSRRIAMIWRKTSAHGALLTELAELFRDLPPGLVEPAVA
jgi:LysR family hydrogen peroxide-inducible transcriptional activator